MTHTVKDERQPYIDIESETARYLILFEIETWWHIIRSQSCLARTLKMGDSQF